MHEQTFYEFLESTNKPSLTFKDPKLENKYKTERLTILTLNKSFLLFLLSLLLILILRYVEELIFMLTNEDMMYVSRRTVIFRLMGLVAVLLYELLALVVGRLRATKGIAMLAFIFSENAVASYSFSSSTLAFVPT
eukprot:TRINITY_DN3044_c0_g2_i5.p1 TRINITY_DN3044_c0_g2~~TRINITY_DN3044_c0_g2_i5.p1  ORF type:complete len:136 (+),score=35.37 TRINITY_DN3044_c0_g2_i5:107-514(+)